MSSTDNEAARTALDEAIVAFTGRGRRKIPTSDSGAVLALDPAHGAELLKAVEDAVRISDAIPFEDVAPFDTELRERLYLRIHELLPGLGRPAIEALGWRWGFLNVS